MTGTGPVRPGLGEDVGAQLAEPLARLPQRREELPRQAEPVDERAGPLPGRGVEQPRRRGVGDLRADRPGEPVGEQVGHEQQRAGRGELRGVPRGRQLEDRVERQVLQSGHPVQLLGRHRRVHGRHRGLVPGVAVVHRVAQQCTVGVQQAVVHRPAVDAHAVQPAEVAAGGPEPVEDPGVQREDVPVQGARRPHRPVGEAVHLVQVQRAGPDPGGHDPAARGAQVDGREGQLSHCSTPARSAPRSFLAAMLTRSSLSRKLTAGRPPPRRSRPARAARSSG